MPVVYVDLAPDEETLVLATLDPLSAMAEADQEALDSLLAEVVADGALARMLDELAEEQELKEQAEYTQKVVSPIYEPTGPQPAINDLYDTTTTDALTSEIVAADLPEDVRTFLLAAAQRHTVLRFDRIANYYAHATHDIQTLMEHSARVIIDFDQAVERGFVKLNENVLNAFSEDYQDA